MSDANGEPMAEANGESTPRWRRVAARSVDRIVAAGRWLLDTFRGYSGVRDLEERRR
ncbi:hypothetical protein ACFQAS_04995 [Halopenitus salinus]|jgi:hypothetical protein|uniref:Uncharacterized protein n=1 Tax=Halopenitus salinus TaxID=1198295 RepID=A0ABD5UXJ4_9EURY